MGSTGSFILLLLLPFCLSSDDVKVQNDTPEITSGEEADLSSLHARMAILESIVGNRTSQMNEQKSKMTSQETLIENLKHQVQGFQSNLIDFQKILSLVQSQVSGHSLTIENLRKTVNSLQLDVTSDKRRITALENATAALQANSVNESVNIAALLNVTVASKRAMDNITASISYLNSRSESQQSQLSSIASELSHQHNVSQDTASQILSFQGRIDATKLQFVNDTTRLQANITILQKGQASHENDLLIHKYYIDKHGDTLNNYSSNISQMLTKMNSLESTEHALISSFNVQQQKLASLSASLSQTKPATGSVAFSAKLSSYIHIINSQKLIFGTTTLNHGNSYSTNTGVFTCNEPGVYMFIHSINCAAEHYIKSAIVRNGHDEVYVTASGAQHTDNTEIGYAVLQLNQHDMVWIRIAYKDSSVAQIDRYFYTNVQFSGFKIF